MHSGHPRLTWAEEEFGAARLNDRRNVVRLVSMAASVLLHAHVLVAAAFPNMTERDAAYDFLENDRISPRAVGRASGVAAARRALGDPFVYIPVDQSTLSLRDNAGRRQLGPVGARARGARGLECMSAIALSPRGVPLGIAAQIYWTREEHPASKRSEKRPLAERESRFWGETCEAVREVFEEHAPGVRRWFLMDRGADAWMVLLAAAEHEEEWATIRSSATRAGWPGHDDERDTQARAELWALLNAQPLRGRYGFEVSESRTRKARVAHMELRFAAVTLDLLLTPSNKRRRPAKVWAVQAREAAGSCPAGEEPIEWTLLTTYPVETEGDACRVIAGYTQRWRVEDFHKQWKGGGLEVEQTQLEDRGAIERWARILAAVAMRTLRLTYLARMEGTRDAGEELDVYEREALRVIRAQYGKPTPSPLTMQVAVALLGELGGHMNGKRSAPGPKILARALQHLAPLAQGLRQLEAEGKVTPFARRPGNQRSN